MSRVLIDYHLQLPFTTACAITVQSGCISSKTSGGTRISSQSKERES